MSFNMNLFRKDIDRLKSILVLWLFLIFMQSALLIGGTKLVHPMAGLAQLIGFLQGILIIIIIPLIIHEDPLVGTTAFWLTRPISGKRLLMTKILLIFIALIVFPLLAKLLVMAINRVIPRHIFLAALDIFLGKTLFVLPFLILASLTPKFSRYALVGVIIFVSIYIIFFLGGVASSMTELNKYPANGEISFSPSLEASRWVVVKIAFILLGSFLVSHQFLTRKTARTIGLLVASFILLALVPFTWRWDFLQRVPSGKEASLAQDSLSVGFNFEHAIVADWPSHWRYKSIKLGLTTAGLPFGQFAILKDLHHPKIEYPDGKIVESTRVSNWMPWEGELEDRFMAPIQAALENVELINPVRGNFSHTEVFSVELPYFNMYKNKVGTYAANAEFNIYEYETGLRVPLKRNASGSSGSDQILIDDILGGSNQISVVVTEKKVNLLFDRAAAIIYPYDEDWRARFREVYLIVNKKRNEALLAESGDPPPLSPFGPMRLEINTFRVKFILINDQGDRVTEIDKGWLADAEFVRLDAKKIGTIATDVVVDNFFIPSDSADSREGSSETGHPMGMQK